MPTISQQRHASDVEAIKGLAKGLYDAVPKNTSEATLFSAAITLICTVADLSPNRSVIADLMHAAADELMKGERAFARHPTH